MAMINASHMIDDCVSGSDIKKRMINRSWGIELWDQFDNVSKYTEKSIQFCEKYESFLKDRCTIEDDYAKALKKLTKTYTPKFKEQEEFHNKYSYTLAFCATLRELQDLASQHELIAENLREHSVKQIQTTIKDCREQRKRCLDDHNKIKRHLDKQQESLLKSLRKYEECYDSARRAKESYEKAHEDLDLSRAQLEKARDTMTLKSKICDDAHVNYSAQVSLYNDTQRVFYERQLPAILTDFQQLDQKRSEELKTIYCHFIQSHLEVLPRIQTCLDEMSKQTEQLNAQTDTQVVIDEYKTGYAIPDDQKVIDLNTGDLPSILYNNHDQQIYDEFTRSSTLRSTNSEYCSQNGIATIYAPNCHMNGTQTLMPSSTLTSRKSGGAASTIRKIFGSSSQRKSSNGSSMNIVTMNTPYNTLPPAQRLRKFQEQILNCKNELEKKQKAKEGLTKMKLVFQENPKFGDEQDVTQQIIAIEENIDKLLAEIKRFESYISEIERARIPTSSDVDVSSRSHGIYDSDQSISTHTLGISSQHQSSLDIPDQNGNGVYEQSNEFHRLPSITSMTVHQIDSANDEANGSFEDEDEDADIDQADSQYPKQSDQGNYITAQVLYDFNSYGMNGSQYVNAASIYTGECVDILEDDHGDGWTRIKKLDGSTGFVPSSYLRLDCPPIESGRF